MSDEKKEIYDGVEIRPAIILPHGCNKTMNLLVNHGESYLIKRLVESGSLKLQDLLPSAFYKFEGYLNKEFEKKN